jgi:hypothetical protein
MIEHRVNGWLCSSLTAEAVAEGILYFLAESATAQRAGAAAKKSADQFSQQVFEKNWTDVISKISR